MQYDIRRLDIYRKIPKDLTQPTYAGACISVLSCIFICYLFISELSSFLTPEIVSDMFVADPTNAMEKIDVNLDMTLLKMDCKYVGLDIQDDLGRHEVGFIENTEKIPVGDGGCRFKATFKINKVPGNFHVSTHSSREQPSKPDMTHKIHEITFGEKLPNNNKPHGSFNSLSNISHEESFSLNTHEYFLKIVPSYFEDSRGNTYAHAYQYTFAHRSMIQLGHGHQVTPVIWFKYDMSPITVKYIEKAKPIYSFLTTVCAIVGGTFTVAGIVDSMLFTASEIFKKAQMGKLS